MNAPTRSRSAHAPKTLAHEYDGIREYDNPTPGWWVGILYASIAFSILYAVYWHGSVWGWTIQESWADDERAEFVRIFSAVGELDHTEEVILTQMNNPKFMIIARATFLGNCASCHGREGGGIVGVNLCDDSYKNVKKVEDIYTTITEGANSGAMPSWKNRLTQNTRVILAAYVASLRGTTPAGGKGPEGEVIPPWPKAPEPAPASAGRPAGSAPGK